MKTSRARSPTGDEIAALAGAVQRLTERIDHLTLAMDELFIQVQWSNHQRSPDYSPDPPFVLTSLPLDPAAKDWRINQVRPEDLPATATPSSSRPGKLF